MSHTHELLRLKSRATPDDESAIDEAAHASAEAALQPPSVEECFAAMRAPAGEAAKRIVAFVAVLGLTAVHPESSRASWPAEDGGQLSKDDVRAPAAIQRCADCLRRWPQPTPGTWTKATSPIVCCAMRVAHTV